MTLRLYDDDSKVFSASRDRSIYLWDPDRARERALQRMGGINATDMLPDHIQPSPSPEKARCGRA